MLAAGTTLTMVTTYRDDRPRPPWDSDARIGNVDDQILVPKNGFAEPILSLIPLLQTPSGSSRVSTFQDVYVLIGGAGARSSTSSRTRTVLLRHELGREVLALKPASVGERLGTVSGRKWGSTTGADGAPTGLPAAQNGAPMQRTPMCYRRVNGQVPRSTFPPRRGPDTAPRVGASAAPGGGSAATPDALLALLSGPGYRKCSPCRFS